MIRVCILDYGLGNIRSLFNALKKINLDVEMYSNLKKRDFDVLIIPGVGSFGKAMTIINSRYKKFIIEAKKNNKLIIGICLGMHIFFSRGYEDGKKKGLGFFKGEVKKIKKNKKMKLPNIGWRNVKFKYSKIKSYKKFDDKKFYFVHSYQAIPKEKKIILANIKYGEKNIVSFVNKNNVYGIQFHPEKSREIGLYFLENVIKKNVSKRK